MLEKARDYRQKRFRMTIEDYEKTYDNVWRKSDGSARYRAILEELMLHFDETACNLSGPFPGNYAYVQIRDSSCVLPKWLKSVNDLKTYSFLTRNGHSVNVESPEHFEKILKRIGKTQEDYDQYKCEIDCFTIEFPYGLFVCGNDDSTYGKFFKSEKEAKHFLDWMKVSEPLNLDLLIEMGFVFTN
jgi:hypothetical protein